ncbi:hypothetical protein CDL12_24577 [Handroanthus impetiginosus]|uniref:Uncharacterized protein n=1 Tax=Handroanthus impetiginosus TaxID=429701 RepID=A0A2G9GCH7_9LAMI|nr:hypothetical protein CDL12_24577 [Handroanthus impetiginosus]
MISDSTAPARPVPSSEAQYESATFTASFSQNAHDSSRIMHHLQNQTIKPSGLRMPSPSLSFFSQPKPSVLHDLTLRNAETDVCGFQKPRNLILQDGLRRTTKADISSNALSSMTEYMASPYVSAGDLIKSNLKRKSIQKFQDHSKNNITERILKEEAALQKVDIEVPSQSGSDKQVMGDGFYKEFKDNYPVKSESCGSEGRRPEVRSERSYAIHESETISVTDAPHKEKNTSNLLVLNHGAIKGTQSGDAFDHRVQNSLEMWSDWEETCKPDSHESNKEQTDLFRYSPGDTDKRTHEGKNLLKTIERASEQRGASQKNGSCYVGNASVEALEHERVMAENSYIGSKNLHADLLKEAAFTEVLPGNLQAPDAHTQNALCASTIGSSKNSINLISEVADDTEQSGKCSEIADDTKPSGKCSEVPDICTKIEIDSHRYARLITSDGLSPEKQICPQKSQQGKGVEKLLCEVPERKAGNEVIEAKTATPQPPGKMHDCSSDKMIRPVVSRELGPVDNILSFERQNDLISTTLDRDGRHQGNDKFDASLSETLISFVAAVGRAQDDGDFRSNESGNVLLKNSDSVNCSNNPHQDAHSQRTETDYNSSFRGSRTSEVSLKNTPGKVAEVGLIIQDGSANNWLISTMSIKESESDMDNLSNVRDSRTGLVRLSESNMSNKQSQHFVSDNAEFVAENLAYGNEGLHFEDCLPTRSLADESCEDIALGSVEDSVTEQNEILLTSLENPRVSVQESPFKHEICNDACLTRGQSPVADTIADSSRFKPTEVCEGTNNSFNGPHPELELKVEAALEPTNNNGDGVNEKSCSFVLPRNAIPFSDEWLAAIEAAGEDVLTRKGGAVQNSPPDKSLPEPSPWSPVKRKNNPIGPFDCTKKFSNIPPSDS